MSGPTPVFQRTDDVTGGRIWSNLVVLPDGRVMISGGSAVDVSTGADVLQGVDNTAEIWDPATGHWTIEADAAIPRLYHSDTILLADGSVLSLGGGAPGPLTNLNGEEYKPGYLFDVTGAPAVRPVIEDAPAQVQPGTEFTMHVDNPASITSLALMPFGAVTHSFDMSARRLELPFTVQADGSLKVDLPANSNLLTPGYWMLFAINNNDVPSIASTVQVKTDPMLYDLPAQRPLDLLDSNMVLQRNGDAAYDAYNDRYVLTPDAPTKHGSFISPKRVDLSTAFDISRAHPGMMCWSAPRAMIGCRGSPATIFLPAAVATTRSYSRRATAMTPLRTFRAQGAIATSLISPRLIFRASPMS